MKQIELAQRLGISKSYLSMILSGQRHCPPELADILSSQRIANLKLNYPLQGGSQEFESPQLHFC